MNAYYDVNIKKWRLSEIERVVSEASVNGLEWNFIEGDIADKVCVDELFRTYKPDIVVNLAAQAGVRYSITNPDPYIESNLIGFYNILEAACCHSYDDGQSGVQHLVYAYSKLYNIPSTGLRFFTVYGPAGRPDMAYFGFTNKLRNNEKI